MEEILKNIDAGVSAGLAKARETSRRSAETLCVKCSECGKYHNMGEEALAVYNSSGPFEVSEKCQHCGFAIFTLDTSESEYLAVGVRPAEAEQPDGEGG